MSNKNALRIKITTGGGTIAILVWVLSTETQKVLETLALGGGNPELQRMSLTDSYKDFRNSLLDARFYTKYDAHVTSDLERYIQKATRNLEFIDKLYAAVAKEKKSDLQFLFENELTVVLGDRELDFAHVYEPLGEEEEEDEEALADDVEIDPDGDPANRAGDAPDAAAYVPLGFSLSPLEGTQAQELKDGDEVFVKIVDKAHPVAEAFLEMQRALLAEDETEPPEEYIANLKELRENPEGGFWAILSLPDATEGLVSEKDHGIRVKRPRPAEAMQDPEDFVDEKTAMKGMHAEPHFNSDANAPRRPARNQGSREEVPMKVILGFAAAAILLSIILLSLL